MKPSMVSSKHRASCDCTGNTPMKLAWLCTVSQCWFSLSEAGPPFLTTLRQLFLRSYLILHSNSIVHSLFLRNLYFKTNNQRNVLQPIRLRHTKLDRHWLSDWVYVEESGPQPIAFQSKPALSWRYRENNQPSYCSLWLHKNLFFKYGIEKLSLLFPLSQKTEGLR